MKKVLTSGMIGNALEWYDYALYGQMAYIIVQLFFPESNETVGLLQTFAVFAIGFVARPFGGVIFGWFGDRYGRRRALSLSVLLMAFSTGAIGLMPTFEHIGIWAPILLILVRIIQGLSIGGEFGGAITYMVEHSPGNRRGIVGSMAMLSLVIGFLFGSLVAAAFTHLIPTEDLMSWGWRLPFIFGIVIGLIGFYIRHQCEESPVYAKAREAGNLSEKPVREALTQHLVPMVRALGIYFLVTMPFYLATIYFITFNKTELNIAIDTSLWINSAAMVAMMLGVPIAAWYSDHIGRKRVAVGMAVLFLLMAYPLFALLPEVSFGGVVALELLFAFLVGMNIGPVPALLAELFPTSVRYTGMSLAYNIAAATFGGTAPMVSIWLISTFGGTHALAFYVMVSAACALFSMVGYRDRSNQALA